MKYAFLIGLCAFGLGGMPANAGIIHPANADLNYTDQSSFHLISNDAQITKGAENFVINMAQRGIDFLSSPEMSQEERKKEFKRLLESSFDMKTLARFSMGRHWRTATDAQKKEYLDLFEKMIIEVYSRRFGEYEGQKFDVRQSRAEGKRDNIVTSYIIPEQGPEVQVDWRIRYKDGKYKVVDVIVEGVSMAVTQRSDFSAVIQRGGGKVDVLLDHLRK